MHTPRARSKLMIDYLSTFDWDHRLKPAEMNARCVVDKALPDNHYLQDKTLRRIGEKRSHSHYVAKERSRPIAHVQSQGSSHHRRSRSTSQSRPAKEQMCSGRYYSTSTDTGPGPNASNSCVAYDDYYAGVGEFLHPLPPIRQWFEGDSNSTGLKYRSRLPASLHLSLLCAPLISDSRSERYGDPVVRNLSTELTTYSISSSPEIHRPQSTTIRPRASHMFNER